MNKRVVLISFLISIGILFASFMLFKNEYTSLGFVFGTGYSLFDIAKIELFSSISGGASTTHTLYGTPFWFYYTTSGSIESSYISILPLIIDFIIIFSISLLVIYSIYKSKFKRMLGFKKKHKHQEIPYEHLWNYIEPSYYDSHMIEGYDYDNMYLRRKKRK